MKKSSPISKIILYQNLGFLGVIVLGFLDDLLQLPTLIFSDHPFSFLFRRTTVEMLLILMVWFLVSNSTRRVVERINYLEKFMRVCAWCRRINYNGEWMRLEEFMRQGFDTPTTHGICTDCLQQQQAAAQRARQAREQKLQNAGQV
jgi:hypothetical protein